MDELEKKIRGRTDSVIGRGTSPSLVKNAERALDVSFPKPLVEYLQRFGWMRLRDLDFYGLGNDVPDHMDFVAITKSERSESGTPLPNTLVPLLNDGAGNLYCMDVSSAPKRRGRIYFWDHTLGTQQVPDKIANGWMEWITDQLAFLDDTDVSAGMEELKRFLAALPAGGAVDPNKIVTSYVSRVGENTAAKLRDEIAYLLSKYPNDDADQAMQVELGYTFDPKRKAQGFSDWLTQIAIRLLG